MKLLHISPSYYPALRFGGPIQSVRLLNMTLLKKGVKVDVLTTNAGLSQEQRKKIRDKSIGNGQTQELSEQILRQAQDDKADWNYVDGVRVKYLDFVGYEHYNFSLQMVKEIWYIINEYDLVHITAVWNFPVMAGAIISLIKKKPYVISPRGVFHQEAITSKSGFVKKLYFNLFAKHYLQKATGIHYTSNIEKEESELILKHKNSFVIPNGIDLEEIENGDQRSEGSIKENYILILGRIDRIKGFDILIPAFTNVATKFSDLYLVIAGNTDTSYNHAIIQLIQQFEISERVIFTGEVTSDEKWALYKNALMFVIPSYSENFGMSVVEAMACGCPVVISDKVGIYKEVEKNKAGIIVETAIKSVEEGILKLLNDSELRTELAKNASAMVEKYYDIDKVAEQMIRAYRLAISRK